MMVAIALLSGVYDLSSLIMIFALDAVMNLMGLAMEVTNQGKKKPNWLTYWIGCLAGIIPWVVFGIYVWGASAYGAGGVRHLFTGSTQVSSSSSIALPSTCTPDPKPASGQTTCTAKRCI